ncbi:hypothetical protein [Vampirovibrio sp.]|uniref:hypothetical protein n=1 Tax=Vampirovibrio sp. TaxID=2717857 RepID=UPI0035937062
MLQRILVAILIVICNLFLLETGARLLVIQAKPLLGKTSTFDRKFQIASAKQPQAPDVLLLGDSLMYFGIYPELLDVLMNAGPQKAFRSFNLATPSASVDMNLFLLKRFIGQSGPPKLVVYNFSPRIFNGAKVVDDYDQAFQSSYYQRCFGTESVSWMNRASCVLERHSALVRYRGFLSGELEKIPRTWFQFDKRMAFPEGHNPELEISDQGWAPAYTVHTRQSLNLAFGDNDRVEDVFEKELGHYHWQTEQIQPLLTYCKQQKIPVLMVWLPEQKLMDRYYRQIGLSQSLLAQRLARLSDQKQVYFLDLSDEKIHQSGFADLDHLNPLGAVKTTEKMAKILSQPPYRGLLNLAGSPP